MSARSLRLVHQILERAIRGAMVNDLTGRNVASLIRVADIGGSKAGRPSKSLTLAQAVAVLDAAAQSPLHAYVVLSLVVGARTEELRAVTWADVDLTAGILSVTRSVRAAGKLKTVKSHRRLELPAFAVTVLQAHRLAQAAARVKAGEFWRENDLVFCNSLGGALDHHNVRRSFVKVLADADLTGFTPRELRHSFVSILSADGMTSRWVGC
jgi:integrase